MSSGLALSSLQAPTPGFRSASPSPDTAFDLPRMSRIVEIRRETPLVKTFVLDCDIDAEPGQFILLWLPGVDEKPMSIAGMSPLTVSVARVGPLTNELHALNEGDYLGWRGPFGRPFRLERGRGALLVAGGYGSAPLYVLAQQALAHGMDVTVAIGARVADELLYADRFEALGVRLLLSTNDGSRGVKGFVTDAINAQDSALSTQHLCVRLRPRAHAGGAVQPVPRQGLERPAQRRALHEVRLRHLRPVRPRRLAGVRRRPGADARPARRQARFRALASRADGKEIGDLD